MTFIFCSCGSIEVFGSGVSVLSSHASELGHNTRMRYFNQPKMAEDGVTLLLAEAKWSKSL